MGTLAPQQKLVTDSTELARAVDAASEGGRAAIDTEFMREKTYRARLCLVQIAAGDSLWLVDPLGDLDLQPLADLIAAPEVQVIFHAGKQDLEIFYEMYGVVPNNLLDVQIAAAFAGYGASLSYGRLVQATLGVALTKGESYTDWCRRPLTEAQLRYAADDVRYLFDATDRLLHELEEAGRSKWLEEELKEMEDEGSYRLDLDEVWRKVGGRGSLSPRASTVLRELARWREETAIKRDIPRGWVIKDATLVDIARRAPKSIGELKSIRGFNAREADRAGAEIIAAIERGRAAPAVDKPDSPDRSIQARARMVSGLADAVVRARCEKSGLATELVATRGELEALMTEVFSGELDESRHRILHGWRREIAGDAVVDLAEGKLAVRVLNEAPFVEEVRGVGGGTKDA
ncbi:MAG TPA: ribonuclease D [Actinomycetota bacterium]|nr:ribonuclease D [Actinomycetota bacterium]